MKQRIRELLTRRDSVAPSTLIFQPEDLTMQEGAKQSAGPRKPYSPPRRWDAIPEQNPQSIPVVESLVRRIPLTRGYVALVDADQHERLSRYRWYAKISQIHRRVDAVTVSHPRLLLHRLVINAPAGVAVDHINARGGMMADGVTLDDRACNLRLATDAQNAHNTGLFESNTTGFKGVSKIANGSYSAQIAAQGKHVYLGLFPTAEEAAHAYDWAAIQLHDVEFVRTNLPLVKIDRNVQIRILEALGFRTKPAARSNSGHTGVSFNTRYQKWYAEFRRDKRTVYVGRFDTAEAAIAARQAAINKQKRRRVNTDS